MTASIMPKTNLAKLVWAGIAILGASTIGGIARMVFGMMLAVMVFPPF